MDRHWNNWITKKAEPLLGERSTPLFIKELAWKTVNFAVRCGQSHPVSFILRPVISHHRLKTFVGINLVLATIYMAILQPVSAGSQNGSGNAGPEVVSAGETSLTTRISVQIPLTDFKLTQGFWLLHSGLDMAAPAGTPVKPVMAGKVTETRKDWFGYGNLVIISHGKDFESWYGHLSKIDVMEGEAVDMETVIGEVGSTGRSTGPHLHLEIHEDGRPIDPAPVLDLK
jgi:murein DD-endopeptidase MepM/ murein hydrolase activator NlpD